MISFVIYEGDSYMRELYSKVIKKFFYTTNDVYRIHEFSRYARDTGSEMSKIEGKRIYLICDKVPGKCGLDLARKIRKDGDILSPIILFTKNGKYCIPKYTKNTLILNIIFKDDSLIRELWCSLKYAYIMVTKYSALTFSIFDEVFRLPYDDIYYIEKNAHDDTITIYTKDDSYTDYISIKKIDMKLHDDARFFKTHRSCIINLFNVSSYNRKDNIVTFNNGLQTNLISRDKKKELSEKLGLDLTVYYDKTP